MSRVGYFSFYLKTLEGRENETQSMHKDGEKVKYKTGKQQRKIKTKNLFFDKIDKIDNPLD